jgi:hypothetical protein
LFSITIKKTWRCSAAGAAAILLHALRAITAIKASTHMPARPLGLARLIEMLVVIGYMEENARHGAWRFYEFMSRLTEISEAHRLIAT